MPKVEKQVHLDMLALYMETGGMCPEFFAQFRKVTGKSRRTAYDWEKAFGWKGRIKEPIDEAIEELKEADKLNAEELISGLLDLCRNRMDGLAAQSSYLVALFATVFDKIPTKENPKPEKGAIEVESISDLKELVLAQSRLVRDEQGYMRLLLTLVGEPEKILEDRMIVQFVGAPPGLFDDMGNDA